MKKGTKKPLAAAARGRGRAPWYHLFLPLPRGRGLNGYPAIPSLCNGRTRSRSTCPRRERSSDGSGEEISSRGTRPLAPAGNSLTGSLRALRFSVCTFVGLHYTPLSSFVKRDFLCLPAGAPSFGPKTPPLKDPSGRMRLGRKAPFLLTFGKKFAMIL